MDPGRRQAKRSGTTSTSSTRPRLAEIDHIANELRKYHYSRTLPWTDKGHRALPSNLFFEYQQELAKYKQQFQKAVDDFIAIYPQLVQNARLRLGTMYRPEDYLEH